MIKLYWRDETKTVLIAETGTTWTWDEYHSSIAEIKALLAECAYPVVVLVDTRQVISSAVPINALSHINQSNFNHVENLAAHIIVSESRWIEAITAIFKHMLPEETQKIFFARTMEKAEKYIKRASKRRRVKSFH